jgi:hypothetical protein
MRTLWLKKEERLEDLFLLRSEVNRDLTGELISSLIYRFGINIT